MELLLVQIVVVFSLLCGGAFSYRMEFNISTTWDNSSVDHNPIQIWLYEDSERGGVFLEIRAPFFNDPPAPSGKPGEPFPNLWDYEVVEAFFLGKEDKYLEVECCPHGQHIVLLLSGRRNAVKMCLPLEFKSKIEGKSWHGIARIPSSYFPPNVHSFNAYAIHGSGKDRVYGALYPTPKGHFIQPDFHRLEYFKPVSMSELLPSNVETTLSDVWQEALKQKDTSLTC